MIRHLLLFSAVVLFATNALAAPTVSAGGVVNAATYLPDGLLNSGIAQGSIFLVFGSGMGPSTLVSSGYPLKTVLPATGGTSIKITVGGTTVDALMVYTSAGQVAAILPSSTQTGSGTLTLTYNGETSASVPILVIKSSFGMFTLNQGGTGPAVLTNASYKVNTLFASARPGDTMILWGTGLGPITADETMPPPVVNMTSLDVKVYIGGQLAHVSYQGRSPCCSGLDQINFVVPSGVSGCYLPVAVTVGGVVSNFPSMSVAANGGTCSDPDGLSASALDTISGGKDQKVGVVVLSRFTPTIGPVPLLGTFTLNQDTGAAFFYDYNESSLIKARGVAPINVFGSCSVAVCLGTSCVPHTAATGAKVLDAGAALTVTAEGTNLKPVNLPKNSSGGYTGVLGGGTIASLPGVCLGTPPCGPDFLNPGNFSITGPGGSDVGALNVTTTIKAPEVWTNSADFSCANNSTGCDIPRSSDSKPIKWTPGDSSSYVAIVGTSTTNAPKVSTDPPQLTGTFFCSQTADAGQFVIPSWVLSAMPASGSITQQGIAGISVPNGFLFFGSYPTLSPFSPLPTGLDLGYVANYNITGQNVAYQ